MLETLGEVTFLLLREGATFREHSPSHPKIVADIEYPEPAPVSKYALNASVNDWMRKQLPVDQFDVVVGRYLNGVTKVATVPRQPVLVDADDLVYRYPPASSGIRSRWVAGIKGLARLHIARHALRRFDHVWFSAQRDILRARLRRTSLAPNFLPIPPVTPEARHEDDAPTLLFVGALWYEPNRDAVDWFLSHCWATLRARLPSARLRIVGGGPPDLRERWGAVAGVVCPGFVPDIAAEYREAGLVIAPVRYGGGFQIKVLESLVHARASVITPFAAEGFGSALAGGDAVAVAATPAAFVGACSALLMDRKRANMMGMRGREIAARHFTRATFEGAIQSVVESVLAAKSRHLPA